MKYVELLENLVTGEFTFGFELEAILLCDKGEEESLPESLLEQIFEKYNIKGTIKTDQSIVPDKNDNKDSFTFEFVTSPTNVNNKNILNMMSLLQNLKKENIYTNGSCGFHIHIKYPTMTSIDMKWIMCCISMNDDYKNIVSKFKEYDFYDLKYADMNFLNDIQKNIETNNMDDLKKCLTSEKYRVLRIHPQGTLEWRGPRNFSSDPSTIKDFVIHFYSYIKMVISCINATSIGNIDKNDFYKLFSDNKQKFSDKEISFIKNYRGSEKELAIRLIKNFPQILDVVFKSPPKLSINNAFIVDGDVIGGEWNISLRVSYYGNFGNAIFKEGAFCGNWLGTGTWIGGEIGYSATLKGKKMTPEDIDKLESGYYNGQ